MGWIHGNILNKTQNGNPVFSAVIGPQQIGFGEFFKGPCHGHPVTAITIGQPSFLSVGAALAAQHELMCG